MRKLPIICLIFLCLLLCSAACSRGGNQEIVPDSDAPLLDFEYTSIKQLADEASLIVLGSLYEETPSDEHNSFYTIAVDEMLRGDKRDEIKVYAFSNLLKQDVQYMLFLQEGDSVFYLEPMIAMVDIQSIIEIHKDGSLVLPKQFTESYSSIDELRDAISELPTPEYGHSAPQIITAIAGRATDSLEAHELIEKSDVVFSGEITALTYVTPVAAGNATISIITCYKGSTDGDIVTCLVPQGLVTGEKYLFFRSDGISSMPSRKNSVYRLDEKECNELINLLEKLK